jgi:hypothetical protein
MCPEPKHRIRRVYALCHTHANEARGRIEPIPIKKMGRRGLIEIDDILRSRLEIRHHLIVTLGSGQASQEGSPAASIIVTMQLDACHANLNYFVSHQTLHLKSVPIKALAQNAADASTT